MVKFDQYLTLQPLWPFQSPYERFISHTLISSGAVEAVAVTGNSVVGRAGVSLALLRAGQALGNPTMIDHVLVVARDVTLLPYDAPDVITGSADRLRLHLHLWRTTGEACERRAAPSAGAALVSSAKTQRWGELGWSLPPHYGAGGGATLLGYAHGAAGIGDALLDLFRSTDDQQFLDTALEAARWLVRLARLAFRDGSGVI